MEGFEKVEDCPIEQNTGLDSGLIQKGWAKVRVVGVRLAFVAILDVRVHCC